MAEDLRGGLSFCSSGPAYWSHDIGGFEGTANAANYKRWVAFGLLSTHSRLHGSGSYRVPWLFDEESVDVMRHFVKLKNRLAPYLLSASHEAHDYGWPVMRTMFVEFPNDPGCRYLDRQYMLGSAVMVMPVFDSGNVCEHYLPAGTWVDLLTNELVRGGSWRNVSCDFFHLPLMLREDSIVPMSTNTDAPAWSQNDELVLNVGYLTAEANTSVRVVSTDGGGLVTFTLRREGDRVTLRSDAIDGRVTLLLRGRQQATDFTNGRATPESAEGLLIEWVDLTVPLTFTLGGHENGYANGQVNARLNGSASGAPGRAVVSETVS
jgi:alpha-D-xyloside xylohydrolase